MELPIPEGVTPVTVAVTPAGTARTAAVSVPEEAAIVMVAGPAAVVTLPVEAGAAEEVVSVTVVSGVGIK